MFVRDVKSIKKYISFLLVVTFLFSNTISIFAKTSKPQKTAITISFAGDCTLGYDTMRGYGASLLDEFDKQNKNYGYFFENVVAIFERDDLTVVNLEGPLTNAEIRSNDEFVFKGPPEFTNILKAGNIEAVNVANNHTFDYLQQGYDDTLENLKKADIVSFGNAKTEIIEVKGVKVGLLGYKGFIASKALKDQIKKEIEEIKSNGVQIVVVSFHWGFETYNYPNNAQTDLGRYAVDCGANLVVGHHPHVMEGIELYNNAYIVYSLGNFSFGGNRNPADKDTFIFQQKFTFTDGVNTENAIKIIPCLISSVKTRNDFRPTPAVGDDYKRIVERLNAYSKPLNEGDILKKSFVPVGETAAGYLFRKTIS